MRKSRNIKVNNVGKASCLLLILLAFLAINPVVSSVYAEEVINEKDTASDEKVSVQADIPSAVSISFAPSSGSASLSPTTSAGQSAQINVLATVGVQNSGGYSVYVKSNTQNLVGKNSSANVIPGISGTVTYDNLATNTWGYSANEGTAVPEGATYKALSVTGNGDKVAENTGNKVYSDRKQVMLSFAAKIGTDMPADTYQNTVTMSVVSSPLQTTLTDISEMQSMTTAICEASAMYETKQLKDTRDGKYYWVSKLADGKCWMTQNLALDLENEWPDASLSDYDTISTEYRPIPTATEVTADTIGTSNTSTRSWNLGEYVMAAPNINSGCGAKHNTLGSCPEQVVSVLGKNASSNPDFFLENGTTTTSTEYDAHYTAGNYYTWNTATAGTGGSITSGQATGSICPKGWRLPITIGSNDFSNLISASGSDTVEELTSAPYFLTENGVISVPSDLLATVGTYGSYWSSGTYSGDTSYPNAVRMLFIRSSDNSVAPLGYSYQRYFGRSVRCIAR